ncbi:2-aminoethylphosphonate ABC transporter substrate-binding protein [Thermogemmatispora aurantia]|uniref:2-aminoethylphosphonate ABC transporter substrate-binding protein n=1 Tax=Thermogemmatispora aurantia TaxID=2045279 RepID=UPI0012713866|nr:2-aminoethylphosphonate ABC transporter substrate-binding protein [Thermogemmatispora aurantia]GER84450.1 2-aminoethylphosphonate ABC transporter substrate-binding protein [Thermogemmatispora aurantia]
MKRDSLRSLLAGGALLVWLLCLLAACGTSTTPAASSPGGGGTITLYTADGLESYYKQVLPLFEQEHHVQVNIVTDGSGAVVNRLQIEKDRPQADVVVTLPPFIQQAAEQGLLAPFQPEAAAHLSSAHRDSHGLWYTFVNNYLTWVYNPQFLAKPPQTFADLITPAYKGKVAYSNPLSAGDGMGVIIELETLWGMDKTIAYLKALEANVKFHTKGTGYLDVLVNRGEIAVANGDLQMDLSDKVQGGMSLQPIFLRPAPGEAPITIEDPYTIALVKGGPNPSGGQALINYLLSPAAQQQVWDIYGVPARDDISAQSQAAKALRQLLQGVRVLNVDWEKVIANQQAWQQSWQSEVLNEFGKPASVQAPA